MRRTTRRKTRRSMAKVRSVALFGTRLLTRTQSQTSSSPNLEVTVKMKRTPGDQFTMPVWTDATENSTTRTWHG
jgi:hypothetical protein